MKALISLLAFVSLTAYSQSCGNNMIRILTVFTADAVAFAAAQGMTKEAVVNAQISGINAAFAASGVNTRVESAGIQSGICCGNRTHLFSSLGLFDGAHDWATGSIGIQMARDAANADIVVVISNYEPDVNRDPPLDVPGVSFTCANPAGRTSQKPQYAVAAANIAFVLTDAGVLPHEVAHVLCMTHPNPATFTQKTGTSPQNCQVTWTIEGGADPFDGPTMTLSCAGWDKTGSESPASHTCGASDWCANHVATYNFPTHSPITRVLSGTGPNSYFCDIMGYKLPSGPTEMLAQRPLYAPHTATSTFDCPNLTRLLSFAPSTVALMNAQSPSTQCFRNTKVAPKLKEAAARARDLL